MGPGPFCQNLFSKKLTGTSVTYVSNILKATIKFRTTCAAIFWLYYKHALAPQHPRRAQNYAMKLAGSSSAKKGEKEDVSMGNRRVRQRPDEGWQDPDGSEDGKMKEVEKAMELLTANVGTGQYAQSILSALSMSSTTNARDIANLQAAITKNYEIPQDSSYIKNPKECMRVFAEHCKKQKGKAEHTGHPKNYALVGLVAALMDDPDVTKEEKDLANRLVHAKVSTSNQEVNLMKCKDVANIVSFCQVVQTPKKGFVNICMFQSEDNDNLMKIFDRIFQKIGSRQYDPPPPKPVNKDIRKWASDQKERY
jgi:hypothetical protein